MHDRHHICCVIAIIGVFLCHFFLNVENNDSRILSIPRSEYIQVISSIIQQTKDDNEINIDKKEKLKKEKNIKRDSFYYLQRSLESRKIWNKGSGRSNINFSSSSSSPLARSPFNQLP